MIITDDHVYIHMPKTGGTWVKTFLKKELNGVGAIYPEKKKIGGHVPAHRIREMFPEKIFVGSVRDKYDWYLSWFNLATRVVGLPAKKKNPRARLYLLAYAKPYDPELEIYEQDKRTFKSVMYGLTHLDEVEVLDQDLLFSPWDVRPATGGMYTQMMEWYYKNRTGDWLIDEWVHTETLDEDIRTLYGVTTDREHPPRNVGKYSIRHELYDEEIYSWIREADPTLDLEGSTNA